MTPLEKIIQTAVGDALAAAVPAAFDAPARRLRRLTGTITSIAEANIEVLKALGSAEALKGPIANQPGYTLDPASHRWRSTLPAAKQNTPITPLHGPFNPEPPHPSERHEGAVRLTWDSKREHYDDGHGQGLRMRGQVATVHYPSGGSETIAEGIGAHQHGVNYAKRHGMVATHGHMHNRVDLNKADPLAEHHTAENLARQH